MDEIATVAALLRNDMGKSFFVLSSAYSAVGLLAMTNRIEEFADFIRTFVST